MDKNKFRLIDNLCGWTAFAIATVVYFLTLEPTASFWDCGEFIASSYKLEIGHPPGNPTFQLLGRFFSLFGSPNKAALLINAMSGLCASLTILFLFWTITHLGRRLMERRKEVLSPLSTLVLMGAGFAGSLAYAFSDTFWFSAVEAEVYAMSSLFTAAVVWCMLKWEECADQAYANRWIVLIAYLMGLSIGVHLLNLLTLPAIVFVYYYKKYPFSWKGAIWTLLISVAIIAAILWGIIPWIPKISGVFDLLFVNTFHLPFNSGMLFFLVLLFTALFWGVFYTYKKQKVLWNTLLLCVTVILIGYSSFAMVVIRSCANTPTNENQPDNPFALSSYLGREQYGKTPLLYGAHFGADPVSYSNNTFHTKLGDKYIKAKGMDAYIYEKSDEMLFPRMHSRSDAHKDFYKAYVKDEKHPTFAENLHFFFDYQVGYMYWRYFMWNFVGRQNDIHGTNPGDPLRGNWESGISFLDKARLGDQSQAPDFMRENKGKNHYYFLPLLLGLIGLFYQLTHDKRNAWITFLLFFLTGLAIVVYLNQPPFQPRERDYAYAASFYAFAIWIGLGILGVRDLLGVKGHKAVVAGVSLMVALGIPLQMLSQNYDDHDRSHRYTAEEFARNYLESCLPGAILITHGDNDTFPLWYAQEVEGVRTDVRIMNTSLMGVDWYIGQMGNRLYEQDPVPFQIPREQYLFGTNDLVPIYERVQSRVSLSQAVSILANPNAKVPMGDGTELTVMPVRKLRVKVNKENALKYKIVAQDKADLIPEYLDFDLPQGKNYLTKVEMMFLDFLSTYEWDRPVYIINRNTDLNIGLTDHFQTDGLVYRFVPYNVKEQGGEFETMDAMDVYNKVMNVYQWPSLGDPRIFADYQNIYTFTIVTSMRSTYSALAQQLALENRLEEAVAVLDRCQEILPADQFPLNFSLIPSYNEYAVSEMIEVYLYAGAMDKAKALSAAFLETTRQSMLFLLSPTRSGGYMARREGEAAVSHYYRLLGMLKEYEVEADFIQPWEATLKRFSAKPQ